MKSILIALALVAIASAQFTAPANNAHYTTWDSAVDGGAVIEQASKFCVLFQAKGANDAHILLSSKSDVDRTDHGYEIVIGGWSNTKSVIRVGTQGSTQDTFPLNPHMSGALMSATEDRAFWISLVDGELSVGRGDTCYSDIFMTATFLKGQKTRLEDIKYIAFGAWDTPVKYSGIFMGDARSDMKQFAVPGNGRFYRVFNRPNEITLKADSFELVFKARGDSAVIGFLPDFVKSAPNALEVIIDANNGTATEIWAGTRASGQAKLLTQVKVARHLSSVRPSLFWIRKFGDALAVGTGKSVGQNILAVATVPDFDLDQFVVGWTARDFPSAYKMVSYESEMLDDDEIENNLSDYFNAITENQMETAMIKGGSSFQNKIYEEWQKPTGDTQLDNMDEESWTKLQYKLAAEGNPTAIAIMKGTYPKPTPPKETEAQWEVDNYLELEAETNSQ